MYREYFFVLPPSRFLNFLILSLEKKAKTSFEKIDSPSDDGRMENRGNGVYVPNYLRKDAVPRKSIPGRGNYRGYSRFSKEFRTNLSEAPFDIDIYNLFPVRRSEGRSQVFLPEAPGFVPRVSQRVPKLREKERKEEIGREPEREGNADPMGHRG